MSGGACAGRSPGLFAFSFQGVFVEFSFRVLLGGALASFLAYLGAGPALLRACRFASSEWNGRVEQAALVRFQEEAVAFLAFFLFGLFLYAAIWAGLAVLGSRNLGYSKDGIQKRLKQGGRIFDKKKNRLKASEQNAQKKDNAQGAGPVPPGKVYVDKAQQAQEGFCRQKGVCGISGGGTPSPGRTSEAARCSSSATAWKTVLGQKAKQAAATATAAEKRAEFPFLFLPIVRRPFLPWGCPSCSSLSARRGR
jgi:hypothetical protein